MAMNMAQAAKLVREMGAKVEAFTEVIEGQKIRIKELEDKVDAMKEPEFNDLDALIKRVQKLENVTMKDRVKMFRDYGIHFKRMA